jgi:DNA-binding FadR family transcriptional regulator
LITAIAIKVLPGARLPVERDLAASLAAGRMTVRAALARLVERGLLETRRGRGGGSYVLDQWPESSTDAVGRTLRARLDDLRDRCDAICRLQGTVCRAAAESRSESDADSEFLRTACRGIPHRRHGLTHSKPTAGFIWRSWMPPTTTSSSSCCWISRPR